ncbi:MAG: twin-arginine translocase TatA/TatE family subunit [Bacteroidota bacterium]|nr:twin-arginine translocase TatA/TatE family subunit [Bacteroidota bacterium]
MAMSNVLAFIGGLGTSEVMVIMLVILLLFGAKRIPELAKGLGKGIREFKDATKEIKNEVESAVKDDTHTTTK